MKIIVLCDNILTMDIPAEVEEIKKELASIIIDHLKQNKIKAEDAQKQAREFLSLLPIKDQADLLAKLKNLGDKYAESESVYLHELEKSEAEKRDQTLSQMRDHIKQGNINEAINTAKTLTQVPQG